MITDAFSWVHGTPPATGALWLTAGSAYSTNELDNGRAAVAGTSTTSPIPAFPSVTEMASNQQQFGGGAEWGLHFVITTAFDTLTSIVLSAVTSATSGATNVIASRTLTLAQLAVANSHYFVGVNPNTVLQFLRAYGAVTGSNNVNGSCYMWFGPRTGGEL